MKTKLAVILTIVSLLLTACAADNNETNQLQNQSNTALPELPKPEEPIEMVDERHIGWAESHYERGKANAERVLKDFGPSPELDAWTDALRDLYDAITTDPYSLTQPELDELQAATEDAESHAVAKPIKQRLEELDALRRNMNTTREKYKEYYSAAPHGEHYERFDYSETLGLEVLRIESFYSGDDYPSDAKYLNGCETQIERSSTALDNYITLGEELKMKQEAEQSKTGDNNPGSSNTTSPKTSTQTQPKTPAAAKSAKPSKAASKGAGSSKSKETAKPKPKPKADSTAKPKSSSTPKPKPKPKPEPKPEPWVDVIKKADAGALCKAINNARVANGVAKVPCSADTFLMNHAVDMASSQNIWHSGKDSIVAGAQCYKGLVDAWLGSPPHRANLLNPDRTSFRVGVASRTYEDGWQACYAAGG